MKLSLDVITTQAEIIKNIHQIMLDHIGNTFTKTAQTIKTPLSRIVDKAIRSTPEYNSLLDGQLKGEFGLIAPEGILNNIINRITDTIEVKLNNLHINRTGLEGGLEVGILLTTNEYADLMTVRNTSYKSHGYDITWLKWLLSSGDAVVNNFQIIYNLDAIQAQKSRSGKAIMIEGGQWALVKQIPSEWTGTLDNNFLTRGLAEVTQEIEDTIKTEFINNL